jgi:hemolysin activation/secretion protein
MSLPALFVVLFAALAGVSQAAEPLSNSAPPPFRLPPVIADRAITTVVAGAITVERILFSGNEVIPTSDLAELAAPYEGRSLSEAEIEELRQKLSRLYVSRGYINSGAVFAEPPLDGTTLRYRLVEGRLGEVRVHGQERLEEGYIVDRLKLASDSALNVDLLRERFALLLSDPLFARMNAQLSPGKSDDEAALDINVVRARSYQVEIVGNNHRPPSIGAESFGAKAWIRNLSGYGDLLEIDLQAPHESGEISAGGRSSLTWHMPLGNHGTALSMHRERGQASVLEEPLRSLNIESQLEGSDVGLSHCVFENLRHKFSVGATRAHRTNRTFLLGEPYSFVPGEPDGQTKVSTWRLWQEFTYRSETQVLALRSTFSDSRNNLEDLQPLPAGSEIQPAHRARFWLGQFQYVRQLNDDGMQWLARGALQRTGDRLLALDRISLGGVATVRGYRENQLVRDTGSALSLEFVYPLLQQSSGRLNASLVPFYDLGQGRNLDDVSARLESAGLALRGRWQGLQWEIAVAKRLAHFTLPRVEQRTLQDRGIHIEIRYAVF